MPHDNHNLKCAFIAFLVAGLVCFALTCLADGGRPDGVKKLVHIGSTASPRA